jgi:hypothetical protein
LAHIWLKLLAHIEQQFDIDTLQRWTSGSVPTWIVFLTHGYHM